MHLAHCGLQLGQVVQDHAGDDAVHLLQSC
jgi:hypothetical protein